MFGGEVGWPEIVLVLMIVLIVFGAGKLPGIGKALGESIREFKSASKGEPSPQEKKEMIAKAAESQQISPLIVTSAVQEKSEQVTGESTVKVGESVETSTIK
jgi:sec-independent protein translocase protein TatA